MNCSLRLRDLIAIGAACAAPVCRNMTNVVFAVSNAVDCGFSVSKSVEQARPLCRIMSKRGYSVEKCRKKPKKRLKKSLTKKDLYGSIGG